jgi:hypothetical protein
MTARFALTFMLLGVAPSVASGQTAPARTWTLLCGLSAGGGRRSASGMFRPAAPPVGAGQPAAGQGVGVLDIDAGVGFGHRVAVLALYEMGGARQAGSGTWGTLGLHGAVRAWLLPHVWVEGGLGAVQLGYKPPSQVSTTVSHWWAASPEAAAGLDVFQGPTVSMSLLARYATASFDGLRVTTFAVEVGLTGSR